MLGQLSLSIFAKLSIVIGFLLCPVWSPFSSFWRLSCPMAPISLGGTLLYCVYKRKTAVVEMLAFQSLWPALAFSALTTTERALERDQELNGMLGSHCWPLHTLHSIDLIEFNPLAIHSSYSALLAFSFIWCFLL